MSRPSRLSLIFLAALVALSGCSDDDDNGQAAPTTTSAAAPTTAPSGPAAPASALACSLVPIELVNEKLALTGAQGPFTAQKAGGTVCEFNNANGSPAATLQLNDHATPASFAEVRGGFEQNGVPVAKVDGLADDAYSAQVTFVTTQNTLAALKGHVEVLITSSAALEKIRALMDAVLAKV